MSRRAPINQTRTRAIPIATRRNTVRLDPPHHAVRPGCVAAVLVALVALTAGPSNARAEGTPPWDELIELEEAYFDGLIPGAHPDGWGPDAWIDGHPDQRRSLTASGVPDAAMDPDEDDDANPENTPFSPECFDPGDITELPLGLDRVDHPALLHWLEFYCTRGHRLLSGWFARSGRFRLLIEQELDRQDAPRDLLWVVAIESAFNPEAVSRAGAVGLWQFMPRTARGMGMRVDRQVDERRDMVLSTQNGIAYLLENHDRFGSWPLALAAYNAGPGHVRGQIRQLNVNDFWQMDQYGAVYRGARNYAVRLLAIAIIDRHRTVFGFDGVVEDDPWAWDEVEIPGGVRLSLAASAAGVDLAEIRRLNPALRGVETPADEASWTLRLPPGTHGRFVEQYDQVRRRYGDEHERITLRFGETLADISRRTGIPERVLRHINDVGHRERLPYGEDVLVPTLGRRASAPTTRNTLPVVLLPEQRFHHPERLRVFYEVNTGDTAAEIAEHFRVPLRHLATWNDLDPQARLWTGMTLQIFIDPGLDLSESLVLLEEEVNAVALNSPEHAAWQESESRRQRARQRTHTVRPGDTVLGLAIRYGVRTADIVRWNNLNENATIIVGQQLTVGR